MVNRDNKLIPELISMKDTLTLYGGKSRQWLYNQIRKDDTFPRPVRLGPHSTMFRRREIYAHIENLPRAVLDGISAVERRKACGVSQ